ncbi:FMN-binding protein [Thiohalomonas denitrificans]|uniref:Ion-translocating oxidoreductase complex subunit G n=1 Tax=Thiohalomonas denitrificans TaxID=415747 RepID=A0A1G5PJA1_9GAMM|nr:FMN-binding protein [Thiohalomonas denitrificans]SCZ49129.1 electron transport complex protein RnfG [Thiohalomonas denitrificans]
MTPQQQTQSPALPSSSRLIGTLGVIAMLSGFLVVLVYEYTRPFILENRREAIERAVFQVVPGATDRRDFVVNDEGIFPADSGRSGTLLYAAYNTAGELEGIAAGAAAQGYADIIQLLFGYDPDCQCITGFSVLQMAETPGLGDRILTDEGFLSNFNDPGLDARLEPNREELANPIVTVKHGSKEQPWEIDAVSGATVTSKAVGKALNNASQELLPKLWPHLDELRKGEVTQRQEVARDAKG